MFSIILSIAMGVVLFIALGLYKDKESYRTKFKVQKRCFLALLAPILMISLSCYTFVDANNVGIQYNPFGGGVSEEVLTEGFVLKTPFTKIYQLSTEVQTKTITGLTSQTKDSQYVTNDLDVKYKVNTTDAYQVFKQYRNMDNISESLIVPTVQRAIETVTVEYNIIEVLGSARNDVYVSIEKELDKRFTGTGITVVSITFTDTDGGAEIENAIKAEAVAGLEKYSHTALGLAGKRDEVF